MTNKRIRHRYEVNCSEEEINLIKELSKLEGKKRNKMIIFFIAFSYFELI